MNRSEAFADCANRIRAWMREVLSFSNANATETRFNSLALELFALQYETNPVYHRLCLRRKASPASIRAWKEIPALPVSAFKEMEATSLSPEERTAVFHSSGTTGQRPSRHFHSADSLALYEASLLPWFEAHLLPSHEGSASQLALICLTPPPAEAPHSSLVHMFDAIRRRWPWTQSAFLGQAEAAGAWALDLDRLAELLESSARRAAPVMLLGTAFNFVHLLDGMSARRLRLCLPEGSRVMETGGYKGRSRAMPKPELHEEITRQLGIPASHVVCEYGMSEASSQAYDRQVGQPARSGASATRLFRFPPWCRARIVSPETRLETDDGETGLVQLFDLANLRSVMALQTEDLAIRHHDGFELEGRPARAEARGCSLLSLETRNL